jgi:hypothetical protein
VRGLLMTTAVAALAQVVLWKKRGELRRCVLLTLVDERL